MLKNHILMLHQKMSKILGGNTMSIWHGIYLQCGKEYCA